jgi:hypothetical protein
LLPTLRPLWFQRLWGPFPGGLSQDDGMSSPSHIVSPSVPDGPAHQSGGFPLSTLDEPTGEAYAAAGQPYAPYVQPQFAPAPQPYSEQPYGQQPYGQQIAPDYVMAPSQPLPAGPAGKIRGTWAVIGLSVITLGFYSLYYYFAVHEEMKRHSGEGVGGALGLVIALFTFGLVTPFLLPNEVGNLYARQGRPRPVSATTGLWMLLGSFILIGPLVWLIKTNGAVNAYWRSMGAR